MSRLQQKGIAQQCPYAGGNAVYKARAILGGYGEFYKSYQEDSMECSWVNIQMRKGQREAQPHTLIYPNPAQEQLTIVADVARGYSKVSLLDCQGRTVWKQSLNPELSKREIGWKGLHSNVIKLMQKKKLEKSDIIVFLKTK